MYAKMFRTCKDIERHPLKPDDKCADTIVYKCDICDENEGWQSETEVYIHRRAEHADDIEIMIQRADKEHNCVICLTKHKTQENLFRHFKTRHLHSSEDAVRVERDIFICNDCSQVFFNKQLLSVHMAIAHHNVSSKRSLVQCPICPKLIRCDALWNHLNTHGIQSVACCSICLQKCRDTQDLLQHTKTHPYNFNCDMCAYRARDYVSFNEHVLSHKNIKINKEIDEEKLEVMARNCFVPNKEIHKFRHFKLSMYRGLKLLNVMKLCILCREICVNDNEVKNHILTHGLQMKQVERKKLQCVCGEEFACYVLLKQHIFKLQGSHRAA